MESNRPMIFMNQIPLSKNFKIRTQMLRPFKSQFSCVKAVALLPILGFLFGISLPSLAQTLDLGFNPNVGGGVVETIALQADGKILLGGAFTSVSGLSRNHIARLNADGSLDSSFNPDANGDVGTIVVQSDGRILVGGSFTSIGGSTRNRIARLFVNGAVDTDFNPDANRTMRAIRVQSDGKFLLGGVFSTLGGQTRNYIARWNSSNTLDSSFNPNADDEVWSMVPQSDGKIWVGGFFTSMGGQGRNRIARLNADGTLDTTVNPNADGQVLTSVIQPDGKILVAGGFTNIGGQTRNRVARLNADGSLDTSFNPNADGLVFSLVLQSDGRILVGGGFSSIGGQSRNKIARLNADGSLDISFDPNAGNTVMSIAVQPDGGVLLGGYFTTVGGQARNRVARIFPEAVTRVIELSGDVAFGNIQSGQTATRTLTIENSGNSALNVTNLAFPPGFSGNWEGGDIGAGGNQAVTVTFSPMAAQSFSGNIVVSSNATSGTNSIAVSGQGTTQGGIDDHGDNFGDATPISENGSTAGILGTPGDNDYFRIVVNEAGVLTVETTGATDTFGHLLNALGNEIAFDDNSGNGVNFRIIRNLSVGTYYVRIRHSSGSGTGPYDIVSSFAPTPPLGPLAPPVGVSARALSKNKILVFWRRHATHGGSVTYTLGMKAPRSAWRNVLTNRFAVRYTSIRLRANTRYSYRVIAFDRPTGRKSIPSRSASARTKK